ncbi:diguanylate cyclase [Thermoleophilia bacterium SCSIO 60948]|nr:diguanylate cyclase [Thermoleophilia bacterium SCSIO 60948]
MRGRVDNGIEDERTELRAARERIAALETELSRARSRDSVITALPGVRAFRAQLALEVQRARRYRRPLTVLALDIDGFRGVNVEGGMARGDALLREVAALIAAETRVNDQICRLGGDEFAVLLPETPVDGALEVTRRILAGFGSLDGPERWRRSASIGIAALGADQAPEELLVAAREALEEAQSLGGATFSVWSGGREAPAAIAMHGELVATLESALGDAERSVDGLTVASLATMLAEKIGLGPDAVSHIATAARLHDIGKSAVPAEILAKPGPLDATEWAIVRQHPIVGERLIASMPGMATVARIVRHSHERWDGGGYPDALSGGEIPFGSRIVLVADAFLAMRSELPYSPARSEAEATRELVAGAERQFDPRVVETLVGILYGMAQSGRAAPATAG